MSIRKRINKIISCILTMAMVLSCMANMTPAFAAASIEKNDVPTVYSGSGNETASGSAINIYKQDFEGVTDASTVATSGSAQSSLTMVTGDATYGTYLSFYGSNLRGGRDAAISFDSSAVSNYDEYVIEFDALLRDSNSADFITALALKETDFTGTANGGTTGATSNYLINIESEAAAYSTTFTINGSKTITLENAWYHYKVHVDKTLNKVSLTITDSAGKALLEQAIFAYTGDGNITGMYMLIGKGYYGSTFLDNIVVRETTEDDEFGTVTEDVTVSFELGGYGESIEDEIVSSGSTVPEPTAPRHSGKVFRGWYSDSEFKKAWSFTTAVTGNMTLYAKWIDDPVVIVDGAWYTQSFSDVTDTSTVTSNNSTAAMDVSIVTDDAHGYYLYLLGGGNGARGKNVNFTDLDVSSKGNYTVEFDASILPGNTDGGSKFVVKGTDWDDSAATGYILKLVTDSKLGTTYTVNDSDKTVTIPYNVWHHYKLDVNKSTGMVTVTITNSTTNAVESFEVAYNGAGNVNGMYVYASKKAGAASYDNIVVYETPVEYATVTFNVQEKGTATAPEAQTVVVGETATAPTAPTEEGWVFGGWFTDKECTTAYEFDTPVAGDLELFAKWTEATGQKYTVTFDVQGKGDTPEAQEIEEGKTATKPETDPTYDGWKFGGWYKDAECTTEYSFAAPVTENTTVYAKWTQIFTVTFDVQGKGTAPAAQKVLDGEKATTPDEPTYNGYAFEGWYTDAGCTTEYSFDTVVTKDTTLIYFYT